MSENTKVLTFPAGKVVFEKGNQSDTAYVIKEGVVEIFDESGRIALLSKGAMFGEYGPLDNAPRMASARCITECILRTMPV